MPLIPDQRNVLALDETTGGVSVEALSETDEDESDFDDDDDSIG